MTHSIVFECEGGPEAVAEIDPPAPEPPEPLRERMTDAWAEEPVREDVQFSATLDDEILEPAVVLTTNGMDARQLTVRLKRRPPKAPVVTEEIANVAPRPPIVHGPTRAAATIGEPAPISYPRRARRRGLEGTVVLRVFVDRSGRVQQVEIERSSGHALLDDAARSGIVRWRFSPALRDGKPVSSWLRRSIVFRLTSRSP